MKENRRKCFKCGRLPENEPNVKLYRFPKPGNTNVLRCELWAKYCFPDKSCTTEFQKKLYSEHHMLCNKHFKPTSFIDFENKLLHRSAVPEDVKRVELHIPCNIAAHDAMTQKRTNIPSNKDDAEADPSHCHVLMEKTIAVACKSDDIMESKKIGGNKKQKCQICTVTYSADLQNDAFMARFPTDIVRCKKWLKVVGDPSLLSHTPKELKRKFICQKHFARSDFNFQGSRLTKTAVPSKHLSRAPLNDDLLQTYPSKPLLREFIHTEPDLNVSPKRITQLLDHDHQYWTGGSKKPKNVDAESTTEKQFFEGKYENKTDASIPNQYEFLDDDYIDQTRHSNEESDVEGDCIEIEYLEQDGSADSDDSADMKRRQDSCTPSKMFERDFKLKLDDIDLLFLSYAKTFRSLARQFQTMLKLDIAKLFSRYEMKNASLGPEANKPSESPCPSDDGDSTKSDDLPLKSSNLDMDKSPPEKIIVPRKRIEPEKQVEPEKPDFVFPKEEPKRVYRRQNFQALSEPKTTPTVSSTQVTTAKKPYINLQLPPATGSEVVRAAMPSTLGGKLIFISPDGKILRPVPKTKLTKPETENVSRSFNTAVKLLPGEKLLLLSPKTNIPKPETGNVSNSLNTAVELTQGGKFLRPSPKTNLPEPVIEKVSSRLDPVVSLERLDFVKSQERSVPAPKMVIAESDEDEVKMEDDAGDPEMEMEVHTETVFVAEDDGQFSEVET